MLIVLRPRTLSSIHRVKNCLSWCRWFSDKKPIEICNETAAPYFEITYHNVSSPSFSFFYQHFFQKFFSYTPSMMQTECILLVINVNNNENCISVNKLRKRKFTWLRIYIPGTIRNQIISCVGTLFWRAKKKKIAESKIITLLAYGHRFNLVNPEISLLFERRSTVTFQTS